MKFSKRYKVLLLTMGFTLITYILYVRIIWQRIPKELLHNLYTTGQYWQIFIYFAILTGTIIRLAIHLSKQRKITKK